MEEQKQGEDKRLSQAMKHFYGKKAKTKEFSGSKAQAMIVKNIDEAELTPRMDPETSMFSGKSELETINEKRHLAQASVPSYLKPTQSFAQRLKQRPSAV